MAEKNIKIELTEAEAHVVCEAISDLSYLTCDNVTLGEAAKIIQENRYGTEKSFAVDDLWARIAHKIGKTDSCPDCGRSAPTEFCPYKKDKK